MKEVAQIRSVEVKIEKLDTSLFDKVESQSEEGDKKSWLALQRVVRATQESYVYLEIGSYLGGSIQPYLVDPRCRTIYSIDKRPLDQPVADDRGLLCRYEAGSTKNMLANLERVDAAQLHKVVCFDTETEAMDRASIKHPPDLCFIDGEHTRAAVLRDFEFCLSVCSKSAVIYFHDDVVIDSAIARILKALRKRGIRYKALKLDGSTFAIALGESPRVQDDRLLRAADSGHFFLFRWQMVKLSERLGFRPVIRRIKGFLASRFGWKGAATSSMSRVFQ